MTENLERLKKSRRAHCTVATRLNNEAKTITDRPGQNVSEEELIRLEQIWTLLTKIVVPVTHESKSSKLDRWHRKTRWGDRRIRRLRRQERTTCWPNQPLCHVQKNPSQNFNTTISNRTVHHQREAAEAGIANFLWRLVETSFFDQFNGAVTSNSQITDTQNLQYLKTSVEGDAAELLTSLQITDANVSTACDILKKRYDSKRLIFRAHVHAIVSQKPVTDGNPKALRDLMKTIKEQRSALSNLGQTVDNQDIFFVYLIAEKLPAHTRKCWELSSPGRNHQRYLDMKKFMEERTRAIEAATQQSASTINMKPTNSPQLSFHKFHSNISTSVNTTCERCNKNHKIYQYQSFKALWVQDRAQFIKTKRLCFNCLRLGHQSEQCNGSSCRKCKRKHNSLLHLEANNISGTASTAPTVTTSSTSPQEASNQEAKTVNKNKEKFIAAAQSQNEEEEEVVLPTAIVSVDKNGKKWYQSHSRLRIPKQPHHGRCSTTPWIEEKADGRVVGLGAQEVNNSKGSATLILKRKMKTPSASEILS